MRAWRECICCSVNTEEHCGLSKNFEKTVSLQSEKRKTAGTVRYLTWLLASPIFDIGLQTKRTGSPLAALGVYCVTLKQSYKADEQKRFRLLSNQDSLMLLLAV